MKAAGSTARWAVRLLSGYLCGTHSGLHTIGRPSAVRAAIVQAAHHRVSSGNGSEKDAESTWLGERRWEPSGDSAELQNALFSTLPDDDGIELIVFGSQARGGTSGFSDLDAILVIPDRIADDPRTLRTLRRHVLATQRAVLVYQPMQHHGFEVVTPRLLDDAAAALALPAVAVGEARSLFGRPVKARFVEPDPDGVFRHLASALARVDGWPRHPWKLHRLVAMFELAPTLYLQSTGRPTPKWLSFAQARAEFPSLWRPYDVLNEVRRQWPRVRHPGLELAMTVLRNPWDAVAGWRRLPAQTPPQAEEFLDARTLRELQALILTMVERVP